MILTWVYFLVLFIFTLMPLFFTLSFHSVSQYQKGKTRKVKAILIYWSKR